PRPARAPSRGNAWRLPMHNWRDAVTEAAAPPAPTREQEEQELSHLLGLPEIARSANLVRLLSFICEKYFEGKADEIRESAIAVQALGRRKDGFDSQVDPIVRVTARTLRKRLEDYYGGEGRGRTVHLVLPTGPYVPRLVRPGALHEGGPPPPAAAVGLPEHAPDRVVPRVEPPPTSREPTPRRLRFGRHAAVGILIVAASAVSFWAGRRTAAPPAENAPVPLRVWGSPVWSDEFNGVRGSAPAPTTWAYDVGNNAGWGNNELEVYCAALSAMPPCDPANPNAFQDGQGNLVIRAVRTAGGHWTSARLRTGGLREFQYGRIE